MWRARRGGPRTPSTTTDANLNCAFVENAPVFVVLKIGRARPPHLSAPSLIAIEFLRLPLAAILKHIFTFLFSDSFRNY